MAKPFGDLKFAFFLLKKENSKLLLSLLVFLAMLYVYSCVQIVWYHVVYYGADSSFPFFYLPYPSLFDKNALDLNDIEIGLQWGVVEMDIFFLVQIFNTL